MHKPYRILGSTVRHAMRIRKPPLSKELRSRGEGGIWKILRYGEFADDPLGMVCDGGYVGKMSLAERQDTADVRNLAFHVR
jgi:hypothetical protein